MGGSLLDDSAFAKISSNSPRISCMALSVVGDSDFTTWTLGTGEVLAKIQDSSSGSGNASFGSELRRSSKISFCSSFLLALSKIGAAGAFSESPKRFTALGRALPVLPPALGRALLLSSSPSVAPFPLRKLAAEPRLTCRLAFFSASSIRLTTSATPEVSNGSSPSSSVGESGM